MILILGEIMQQLIYASTALPGLTLCEVQEILTTANKKNKKTYISGMLLYDGIFFLQVLEGASNLLDDLMQNIQNDSRHNDILLLGRRDIDSRNFEEWTMGFVNSADKIKEVIWDESKRTTFNPHQFEYDEALNIIKKLSYLI